MPIKKTEPADSGERPIGKCPHAYAQVTIVKDSSDPLDAIPGICVHACLNHHISSPASSIPASGRGNSEDGKAWLNPSANQLFRAMKRRDKPIEKDDAPSVAVIHEM